MASVCFYFQVHQPYRLRRYSVFDTEPNYFDEHKNAEICRKVANKCYLPTNQCIYDLIKLHQGRFKVSYALTGVVLEQFEAYAPEVIESFKRLAGTGCVEFVAETFYHSLSFLYSRGEFMEQIRAQMAKVENLFGYKPTTFRNTELIFNNQVAEAAAEMGFKAIIAEGTDHILGYRSPNFVYRPPNPNAKIAVLLKNYRLSDDIAFRFSNRGWTEWPLTAEKFARWVDQVNGNGYCVNLFMDYETFGEHQWSDTGIFDFLYHMPGEVMKHPDNNFMTPSEIARTYQPVGVYDAPHMTSWADTERDLSAWLGNAMQSNALHEAYQLEQAVKAKKDPHLLHDWRRCLTSDHFYYMCTKYFADGDVHKYFNPYESPYDSYINFMNALDNIRSRTRTPAAKAQGVSAPA